MAAAHLHLRSILCKSAMQLQQADGAAAALGSSSSSSTGIAAADQLLLRLQQHFWMAHG
jgi:hypothetical protein